MKERRTYGCVRSIFGDAVPHFLTAEDEYKGYRIPANSIVIKNIWAILHDETVYPDPYAFKPKRFLREDGSLNPAVPDPEVAFGYGRRPCPRRHMANASLFITVASVLATFDITKALDSNGRVIEPSYEFDSGFIMCTSTWGSTSQFSYYVQHTAAVQMFYPASIQERCGPNLRCRASRGSRIMKGDMKIHFVPICSDVLTLF
ncbi:Cytochrome P450 [Mycena sanguinolenta]|uniref:Cytochrome P450 n=1 Tax=Mycena sanguinolenta TaxID=230812 RepID=A0A8H7CPR6_9AGAR|nr:Cytochrome P450 [Mycena sanguinolenta]